MKPDHRWIQVEKDKMKAFLGLRILHEYCKFTRGKNVLGKGSSIWKFWNITCHGRGTDLIKFHNIFMPTIEVRCRSMPRESLWINFTSKGLFLTHCSEPDTG